MYDNQTKNQFIELRAKGLSLDAISTQLSVPKTTLCRWHHDSLEQIQRLRALQWHLLEDQIGERLEDILGRIAQRIRKWDNKLDGQLSVFQKPGDSIRVIRESRREYLQLRALLLAPLQPTRGRAACLSSLDPEKRDKTRQTPVAPETTPLPPNDLQQPKTAMSHFPVAANVRQVTPPEPFQSPSAHDHPDTQPPINTPLQRGEPAQPLAAPTASAVYPGCHGEPIPPVSGGASALEPPTPVAESSDTLISNNGSPALPLPGGEGWGEGQTGSPRAASRYIGIDENDDPKLGRDEGQTSNPNRPPRSEPVDPPSTPKKHKPYWLNGHYYQNPEYIARAADH